MKFPIDRCKELAGVCDGIFYILKEMLEVDPQHRFSINAELKCDILWHEEVEIYLNGIRMQREIQNLEELGIQLKGTQEFQDDSFEFMFISDSDLICDFPISSSNFYTPQYNWEFDAQKRTIAINWNNFSELDHYLMFSLEKKGTAKGEIKSSQLVKLDSHSYEFELPDELLTEEFAAVASQYSINVLILSMQVIFGSNGARYVFFLSEESELPVFQSKANPRNS